VRQVPEAIVLKINAATVFLPVTVASGFPALRPAVLFAVFWAVLWGSLFTFTRMIFNEPIFAGLIIDSIVGCRFGE
jgi:hypothetical protein